MGWVEDVYRVCLRILWDVYVWSIGVRYIYLISVNVYGGYTYIYICITFTRTLKNLTLPDLFPTTFAQFAQFTK